MAPDPEADTRGVEPLERWRELASAEAVTVYGSDIARFLARIDAEAAKRREAEREREEAKRDRRHMSEALVASTAEVQRLVEVANRLTLERNEERAEVQRLKDKLRKVGQRGGGGG